MKSKLISVNTLLILFIVATIFACKKEDDTKSERFMLLTGHTWVNESLLADGVEAGGPGELLESFNGDTKFNEDGTGYIGTSTGDWDFNEDETEITIFSDALGLPVTANVVELTSSSFKIKTSFPSLGTVIDVQMSFIPK